MPQLLIFLASESVSLVASLKLLRTFDVLLLNITSAFPLMLVITMLLPVYFEPFLLILNIVQDRLAP